MVVRRKRKLRRMRGSRSHGWGVVKDHKGSGMQGGVGKAGTMSHHYIQVVKEEKRTGKKIIGKFGFKRPQNRIRHVNAINVSHLDQQIDRLVEAGKAKLRGKTYTIDLNDISIDKLLAQGEITRKVNITVTSASKKAIEKVEAQGGSVKLPE